MFSIPVIKCSLGKDKVFRNPSKQGKKKSIGSTKMKMQLKEITISELFDGYTNDGEDGVYAYDGKLTVRPNYQREFVYGDKQRDAVIDSIVNKLPLGLFYWANCNDEKRPLEILDGQQRVLSICMFVNDDFSIDHRFWHNLFPDEQQTILDYKITVWFCDGTDDEKLAWFRRINRPGAVLTNQELLNATYTGAWLSDAKHYFSKNNCVAAQLAKHYMKGNPNRQDYLEKVLKWVADRDGLDSGQDYMARHQHDTDANDLWLYFQSVINWAKALFPTPRNGITDKQEWGLLYNKYKDKTYDKKQLEEDIQTLLLDDDVTKQAGIIPYILSGRETKDERWLSLRGFTLAQKRRAYERQQGICPICGKHFEFDEMQGDHIVPWSRGGHTTDENLQMLCKLCNASKGGR